MLASEWIVRMRCSRKQDREALQFCLCLVDKPEFIVIK